MQHARSARDERLLTPRFVIVVVSGLFCFCMLLALREVPESQRGSVVGTFSAFFDFANGTAGLMVGAIAAATSYRGAFAGGAALAFVAFVLLRAGFGQEARAPIEPVEPELLDPPP